MVVGGLEGCVWCCRLRSEGERGEAGDGMNSVLCRRGVDNAAVIESGRRSWLQSMEVN